MRHLQIWCLVLALWLLSGCRAETLPGKDPLPVNDGPSVMTTQEPEASPEDVPEAPEASPEEIPEAPAEAPETVEPAVMVDGVLYGYTGRQSEMTARCGTMDGTITSQCGPDQLPENDGESNFGADIGYQYGPDGTLEVFREGRWDVFAPLCK